jgi:chemotaxis protein methyltransferase CheR
MKDEQCVQFLQWALPQLHMRWPGFRKVRTQVCKRVGRRLRDLGLADIKKYQAYLEKHPDEWVRLDPLCRITISRFYRDKGVFAAMEHKVLPSLAHGVCERGDNVLRIWSAGCGSGEEPYTVAALWAIELQAHFPEVSIDIVATDADPNMIRRARDACYKFGSLKDLPESWRDRAFSQEDDAYCLKPDYKHNIEFLEQDIRQEQPKGRFDLVLCRNLAFTYFDDAVQLKVLRSIVAAMRDGAALVLGVHEKLPEEVQGLFVEGLAIYKLTKSHKVR